MAQSLPDRHVYGLDIVRFAAAIAVSVFHLTWRNEHTLPIASAGWVGVEIFFVISGFVISQSAKSSIGVARFITNRFLRLYPAAWISAAISLIVMFLSGQEPYLSLNIVVSDSLRSVIGSAILFSSHRIASAYWTMPIELAFYAIVALTIGGKLADGIGVVARGLTLLSAPYFAALLLHQFDSSVFAWTSLGYGLKNALLVRHGPYFALGTYLFLWTSGRRSLAITDMGMIGLAALMAIAGIWVRALELVPLYAGAGGVGAIGGSALAIRAIALFAGGCMFLALSITFNGTISISNRSAGIIRYLGLSTYLFYLLHEAVGGATLHQLLAHTPLVRVSVGITIAIIFAASLVVVTLEDAVRQRLRRLLEHAAKRSTAARYPVVSSPGG